ncbi:N-acetyltransferase [Nakamurella silvestris]|nr:N-acetyltransferase [Nakamurella silvestris]
MNQTRKGVVSVDSAATGGTSAAETITHNDELRRFELTRQDVPLAHLEYVPRTTDGVVTWTFTHTWTEPSARGQGLAAKVTVAGLDAARAAGVTVIPVCPYVSDYIAAHQEYADLLPLGGRD